VVPGTSHDLDRGLPLGRIRSLLNQILNLFRLFAPYGLHTICSMPFGDLRGAWLGQWIPLLALD